MELHEMAVVRLGDLLDQLAQTSAALDSVLLHHGHHMTEADRMSRSRLVQQSQQLLDNIGYHP